MPHTDHAHRHSTRHITRRIIHEHTLVHRHTQPISGQEIHGGIRLRDPDFAGKHQHIETIRQPTSRLGTTRSVRQQRRPHPLSSCPPHRPQQTLPTDIREHARVVQHQPAHHPTTLFPRPHTTPNEQAEPRPTPSSPIWAKCSFAFALHATTPRRGRTKPHSPHHAEHDRPLRVRLQTVSESQESHRQPHNSPIPRAHPTVSATPSSEHHERTGPITHHR